MMPYLGLETQIPRDGLVHGETSRLGQGATQGSPILEPTPDRHLPVPTLDRHLLEPTLDRYLRAPTLDRHLQEPTLAQQHLLTLDRDPTPGNRVGLGPTRPLDSQVLLEPTLVPAPLVFLLDHW